MWRIVTTALALTILFSSSVAAEDSISTVTPSATPKSKRTALIHSLGWTIVPVVAGLTLTKNEHSRGYGVGLTLCGMIIGPCTGHVYAHQMRPFWVGAAIRGGVLFATTSLMAAVVYSARDKTWPEGIGYFALYVCIGGAGLGVTAASAIHDIVATGNSVDKYNHSHGFAGLRITPTYFVDHRAPGVMLTVSL